MTTKNLTINKPTILELQARRKFNLSVNIKRYTTDANGTVLDDVAIPAALKVPFPFHMFSEYDRNGGYQIADRLVSGYYNTILFAVYTWGINTPLFFFNILADINNQFKKGDQIFVYVDDLNNPIYFTFVVISAQQGAYGSLVGQLNITQLDNTHWGAFKIFDMQYTWLNDAQLNQPIILLETKFDSSFEKDTLSPLSYYSPELKPAVNKIVIKIDAIANQHFGFSSFLAYENGLLNLSFIVYA